MKAISMWDQLFQPTNSVLHLQGKRLSIQSALVGSIVFAIADAVGVQINTYLLKINATYDVIAITASIALFVFLIIFGSATTYFPASFLGTLLAKSIEKDFSENRLSLKNARLKRAAFGAAAVLLVCIPLLCMDFVFIFSTGHGDFSVMLFRAGVALVIASFAGLWTGNKLGKLLIH